MGSSLNSLCARDPGNVRPHAPRLGFVDVWVERLNVRLACQGETAQLSGQQSMEGYVRLGGPDYKKKGRMALPRRGGGAPIGADPGSIEGARLDRSRLVTGPVRAGSQASMVAPGLC